MNAYICFHGLDNNDNWAITGEIFECQVTEQGLFRQGGKDALGQSDYFMEVVATEEGY